MIYDEDWPTNRCRSPDYVRDFTLIGLRKLLGHRFVDYVRPRHLYAVSERPPLISSSFGTLTLYIINNTSNTPHVTHHAS